MDVNTLTEHTVAESVRGAGIEAPAVFVEETGSTNSDLMHMAAQGAPAWTVVVAGRQTGGRGRLGRTWVAPQGSSLLMSVLLLPDIDASDAPALSLAAAVAMAEACGSACGIEVRCKWPNDLLVGSRKLGGILPEASFADGRLHHVVMGVGVNLLQRAEDFPDELRDRATSVRIEGGRPDGSALLKDYLTNLRAAAGGPGILDRYRARSATIGRQVAATTRSGRRIQGRAVDIEPSGALVVETDSGPQPVAFGEVEHLD
jgi:BirA family transcriptional regulator, biotin operon repressor / biotin---[acetyl-CoA-carboxylase] ligase